MATEYAVHNTNAVRFLFQSTDFGNLIQRVNPCIHVYSMMMSAKTKDYY